MYISQRKLHDFNQVVLCLHQCSSLESFITEAMSLIRRVVPYENGAFFSTEPLLQLFDCSYHHINTMYYLAGVQLMHCGNVLADITIQRTQKQHDFSDSEMKLLKMLGEHMQYIFAKLRDEKNAKLVDKEQQAAASGQTMVSFTARETEILRLLAQGLSNKEIGERLFISSETVKTHLKKLFAKMSARSRTELLSHSMKIFLDRQ